MCTVSAVLLPGSAVCPRLTSPVLRVICNRDEKRIRTEALPPARREFAERTAILPIDPLSRGTWIGVNDAGLVLCLLNASSRSGSTHLGTVRSRGDIIPFLLDCGSVAEAVHRAGRINPQGYPPFRLLAVSLEQVAVLTANRETIRVQSLRPMANPVMLTSSSLGDHLVDAPRRDLFHELLRQHVDLAAAQQRFHTHQWPDRQNLSVQMSRPDARTVSRTFIEVGSDYARMTYQSLFDRDVLSPAASETLELCAAGAVA